MRQLAKGCCFGFPFSNGFDHALLKRSRDQRVVVYELWHRMLALVFDNPGKPIKHYTSTNLLADLTTNPLVFSLTQPIPSPRPSSC